MSVSCIRGGTPVEHEPPSYYINDPELSAQLNEQSRVQKARQLEERAPTMFEYYGLQGDNVRTPDREESPSLGIGPPTENGVAPYDLNDPELSAQLHLLTELSRVQEARRIEEFDRQMAAGYRPPADDIHTQDREESPPGGVTRPFRHEDAPHRIKDPQLSARLNELSDYFQAQEAQRLEEY
ncbi:MAG: hypothetical protein Q9188_007199, partial [Gyalolechia gomerana]